MSLYTNIPNEEGRRAVAHWLNKHRPQALVPPMEPSNTSILSLLKMVLEFNNFQFNGTHYLQIGGTTMGTRVAPTLANLFMGHFEETHVYTQSLQPSLWVRFIDIFLIWAHGKPALEQFIDTLNNSHRTIKFSSHISDGQVSFLDTLVIKDDDNFYTSLYTKPTDANNFLHFDSAHPTHCKKGIPCGQFLRIRRICAKDRYFLHHAFLKVAHSRTRGYPLDLIAEGLRKAWKHGKPQPLPLPNTTGDMLNQENTNILVTTFQPTFNNLNQIVRKNWDILSHSSKKKGKFMKRT